jgi:hypothetical protein
MADGKTLAEVIAELEGGRLAAELDAAWAKIVAAVMETGRPGVLKITLGIAPTGRRTVKVAGIMSAKEPEHPREATTFFVGNGNELFRDDPAQAELPYLRQAVPQAGDAKVVRMPDTGEVRRVNAAE